MNAKAIPFTLVQFEPYQQEPIISFFIDTESGRAMFRQDNDIRPVSEIPDDKTGVMINYLRVAKVWEASFDDLHFSLYFECLKRRKLCRCSFLCLDEKM
jgi:hypothetical protein